MQKLYDTIVVGAGIEGSATAYHLVKQGQSTLLLEQFPLPHCRGSSHGQSRITRKAYGEDDFYTEMMKEAYTLVDELQLECGEKLFKKCGCAMIGPRGNHCVEGSRFALYRHNIPHEVFGAEEMKRRYPGVSYPSNYECVLDKTGGILMADKMLKAFQTEFLRRGGVVKDGESMLELHPGNPVTIKTTRDVYRCKTVVLALGPWAPKFLPRLGLQLPLKPVRISVHYWKEKVPGQFSSETFPCFLEHGDGPNDTFCVYGLPAEEYPGLVKVCLHQGPNIDADSRDQAYSSWVLEKITRHVENYMPGLESKPSVTETCIYTNTPDHNPILDVHPAWKNIVIAAGFSGHGFKLAPVVGKILSRLAIEKSPEYDMKPFRIDRFFKQKL